LFVCTVTNFSAAEKVSGVKLRVLVQLLSGQIFSHFGKLWLAWSLGGGITSGMSYIQIASGKKTFAAKLGGQSEFGAPYGGISVLLTNLIFLFILLRVSQRQKKG